MLTVNKRDQIPWEEGMTVVRLLEVMKYTYPHIIVAVNGTVVPHDAYAEWLLQDGDDVRVIHMIAGGWVTPCFSR